MSFDDLSHIFNADMGAFIDDIEESIRLYIIGTGKQCIAIVEKIPKTDQDTDQDPPYTIRQHQLHLDSNLPEFAEVLIKFILRKPHDGHDLDSALTEPILKIIEDKYVELYSSHGEEISSDFLEILKNDNILLNSFVERLVDKLSGMISEKAKIVPLLVAQIHDAATSNTALVGLDSSQLASAAVGAKIGAVAGHVLLKVIGTHMSHIITKFLASAAFKEMVMAMVHKLVVQITSAAVLHFLAANIGGAIGGGALMWVAIPIVVAIIIKQIADFPKKLGNEVSKSVTGHLASNFGQTNKDILEKTFEEMFKGDNLLEEVANDKDSEVRMMIGALNDSIVNGADL